jgi:hypothetical protein
MAEWVDSSDSSGGGSLSLLSTPGPYSLPAYLKALGAVISSRASKESGSPSANNPSAAHSNHATPLLAAFIARCMTLEAEELSSARGTDSAYPIVSTLGADSGPTNHVRQSIHLTKEQEAALINASLHRLHQLDDPLLETLKMQVSFESLYATEVQKKRTRNYVLDQENAQQLAKILEIGTNIQSNAQVASLYRAIFKLMLQNGCVDTNVPDRNVDRSVQRALSMQ